MARSMVTTYGMSERLGHQMFGQPNHEVFLGRDYGNTQDYSEETAAKIDAIVLKIVKNAYSQAETLLKANMDELHEIAKYLIKHEKMHNEDFEKVMNGTFVWEDESEESEATMDNEE
jgi:cell division protease FtsH